MNNEIKNSTPSLEQDLVDLPVALQASPPHALPVHASQSFKEGITCLQSGDAAQAVVALSRCVEQAPDFTDGHVFLGLAHALSYDIYPAIDQLETAAKLDERSFTAHFMMAQLSFKLRIPQKGYDAAKRALHCVATLEQRKMLTQLLREETVRERGGIARPCFNKPFSLLVFVLFGSALGALIIAVMTHIR
jgi:hypothetical protein